jgi:hypothetical protein
MTRADGNGVIDRLAVFRDFAWFEQALGVNKSIAPKRRDGCGVNRDGLLGQFGHRLFRILELRSIGATQTLSASTSIAQ